MSVEPGAEGVAPGGSSCHAKLSSRVATSQKNSYPAGRYHGIAARPGKKRAAMAAAHSIVVIAYHILRDGVPYHGLGHDFLVQNPPAIRPGK